MTNDCKDQNSLNGNGQEKFSLGQELRLYPVSLIVAGTWTVYITLLIVLLEFTARNAPRVVDQPWYFDWLPDIALLAYTQLHVAITAVLLGRIAMSSLLKGSNSQPPQSWKEVIFMANKEYNSPVGILQSIRQTRFHLSWTFWLFICHSVLAQVSPFFMNRAYPMQTVQVAQQAQKNLITFFNDNILYVDFNREMAVGAGSAVTQRNVFELFNQSTYTVGGSERTLAASDVFIAGSTDGADAQLSGLRIQGGCTPAADISTFDDYLNGCESRSFGMPDAILAKSNLTLSSFDRVSISVAYCASQGIPLSPPGNVSSFSADGYLWVNSTNQTASASGAIYCNSTLWTMQGAVKGSSLTVENLQPTLIYDINKAQGGDAIVHPLVAAFIALGNTPLGNASADWNGTPAQVISTWQYKAGPGEVVGALTFLQPTFDEMVNAAWGTILHMTAGLAIYCQVPNQPTEVTEYFSVSGRVHKQLWAYISWAAHGIWILLVLYQCAYIARPTFADTLDSYVASRLLVEQPELIKDSSCGGLDENEALAEARFDPVGDVAPHASVGHLAPAGYAPLPSRLYV